MLFAHRWPGNLRELQRVVHTAVAMTTGDVIYPEALLLEVEGEPRADVEVPRAVVGRGWSRRRRSAGATGIAARSAGAT